MNAIVDEFEAAMVTAGCRSGQTVDEYALVCVDVLSLDIDRGRLDSFLS
jgi:hypothetical protein